MKELNRYFIIGLLALAVTANVACGEPARVVTLDQYLIEAIHIDNKFALSIERFGEVAELEGNVEKQTQLTLQIIREIAEAAGESSAVASRLRPPQQGEAHRGLLLASLRSTVEVTKEAADAFEAGDVARFELALKALAELRVANAPLFQELNRLIIAALRTEPQNPLYTYLIARREIIEATSPRRLAELDAAILRLTLEMRTPEMVEAVSTLQGELIALLTELRDGMRSLSPPKEVLQLHQRADDIIAQQIEAEAHWLAAFREGDDAGQGAADTSEIQLNAGEARLGRDWDELVIQALSR